LFNKKAAIVGKGESILASLLTPWYLAALVCLILLACVWIMALRHHPLSFAYPFMSAVRGFVLFGAWFVFHEQVFLNEIMGMLILMCGIALVGISRKS
jgi:drug/metabolite transporter (DMT)-like permease